MAMEINYDEMKRRIVNDENTRENRLFSIITNIPDRLFSILIDTAEDGKFKFDDDFKDHIATYNNGEYILVFTTNNYAYEFATLSKLHFDTINIRTVRYSNIKDYGTALIADGLCFESRIVKEFGSYAEGTEKQILVESYCKIIWKNSDKVFTPGFNILSLPGNEEGNKIYDKFIDKLSSNYFYYMYNIADIVLYEDGKYIFNSKITDYMSSLYNSVFVINVDTFSSNIRVMKVFNDFCFAIHQSSLLKGNMFIFISRYNDDKLLYNMNNIVECLRDTPPKSVAYLSNTIVVYNSRYNIYSLQKCISASMYYGSVNVNFDDII